MEHAQTQYPDIEWLRVAADVQNFAESLTELEDQRLFLFGGGCRVVGT